MAAPSNRKNTLEFVADKSNFLLINRNFSSYFLKGKHVVIATTDDPVVNEKYIIFVKKREY
jgi:hypothetical protein|tara:strand:- start:157 stop:339 length:183 start_codon:yes stop_codon:yes gene_type:complete